MPHFPVTNKFGRRLVPLLITIAAIQAILLISIPVAQSFTQTSFLDNFVHAELGALAATLVFVHPNLTLGFTALLITYQYLQTITEKGATNNDENILQYALGYGISSAVYGLVRYFSMPLTESGRRAVGLARQAQE